MRIGLATVLVACDFLSDKPVGNGQAATLNRRITMTLALHGIPAQRAVCVVTIISQWPKEETRCQLDNSVCGPSMVVTTEPDPDISPRT